MKGGFKFFGESVFNVRQIGQLAQRRQEMGGLWKNDLRDHQPELFDIPTKCCLCDKEEITDEKGICNKCNEARKGRCSNCLIEKATARDGHCDGCRKVFAVKNMRVRA